VIAPAPAGRVRAFATAFMDGDTQVSQDQANQDARSFQIIVAHQRKYKGRVPGMHQANPACKVLIYSNGTANVRTDLPEACYSHDANGKRIPITGWPQNPTLLTDPSSSAWRSYLFGLIKQNIVGSGYDGAYVDVLGGAGVSIGYVAAVPVNPATGQQWVKRDWLAATGSLASWIKQQLGLTVIGNGWGSGATYFNATVPSSIITNTPPVDQRIDGCVPEGWLRSATQPIAYRPSLSRLRQEIDILADSAGHGVGSFPICKAWTSWTAGQRDALLTYALAAYLMGNQGLSFLEFTDQAPGHATTPRPGWYDLDLGAATGPYTVTGSILRRDFDAGTAIINAGITTSVTVQLGRTLRRAPDGAAMTSVTLAPQTAAVLHA
jgi:hypothetical protein